VIYLDTGCFVKLYYPEADSAQVIATIQGKSICYTPLHELEFVNALQLKIFF
jgi:predicted nucleic acid-binding protein